MRLEGATPGARKLAAETIRIRVAAPMLLVGRVMPLEAWCAPGSRRCA